MSLMYVGVGGQIDVLPAIAVGATLVCVLYSAAFVLLGNLTTRPTLLGLLYVWFIEIVMVDELPRLAPGSPWRVGLAATIDLMPEDFPARAMLGAIGDLAPSWPAACGATAAAAVVAVGLCTLLLKRTDSV